MAEAPSFAAEIVLDFRRMVEAARITPEVDEPPLADQAEIERARRAYRARRHARVERERELRRARIRFWLVLLALLLASLVILTTAWLEIERSFGL